MSKSICPTCGQRVRDNVCACNAIATPEDAERAKVVSGKSVDGAIREGEPNPWPYKHEPGPGLFVGWLPASWPYLAVIVVIAGILFLLLIPPIRMVREAASRTQTICNMKNIGLACHAYFDVHKHLPTPKLREGDKDVDLSWRVSILPYLEQVALHDSFDVTVGWDHPRNGAFQERVLPVYGCPFQPTKPNETLFQFFTGPGTMYPTNEPMKLSDIKDGSSNTFLFATSATPAIWTQPMDMAIRPYQPLPLPDAIIAAFADGTVRTFNRNPTEDENLRRMIDPKDGKEIVRD